MIGGEKRRGTNNHASKLDEHKVREIRRRYEFGRGGGRGHPQVGNAGILAREFGINRRTVLGIVQGTTWGWLDDLEE